MSNKIPEIYLRDITEMIKVLNTIDSAGEHLWMTGDIKVTDGEATYTLVYEDDAWWLDPSKTTTKD